MARKARSHDELRLVGARGIAPSSLTLARRCGSSVDQTPLPGGSERWRLLEMGIAGRGCWLAAPAAAAFERLGALPDLLRARALAEELRETD